MKRPRSGVAKAKVGNPQLQFPIAWARRQLRGVAVEEWRALILRAWGRAGPDERAAWRASWLEGKDALLACRLDERSRTGRRFDREAYAEEARVVCGPLDATVPRFLACCFRHSVDFVTARGWDVEGGLCPALSTPAPQQPEEASGTSGGEAAAAAPQSPHSSSSWALHDGLPVCGLSSDSGSLLDARGGSKGGAATSAREDGGAPTPALVRACSSTAADWCITPSPVAVQVADDAADAAATVRLVASLRGELAAAQQAQLAAAEAAARERAAAEAAQDALQRVSMDRALLQWELDALLRATAREELHSLLR